MTGIKLDLGRKIRIGIGLLIIILSFFTGQNFYLAGIFVAATGIFNLCPSCAGGSCRIDPGKDKDEIKE